MVTSRVCTRQHLDDEEMNLCLEDHLDALLRDVDDEVHCDECGEHLADGEYIVCECCDAVNIH